MTEQRSPTVVELPLLKGGSIEDTLTGFARQIRENRHLGQRVEHAVSVLAAEIRGWDQVSDRLGSARCDDGSGSPPLRSAVVDHRPDIVPLVPSREIRSGCDLPASGSVANPTVPPGTVPTPGRRDSRRCGSSHSE